MAQERQYQPQRQAHYGLSAKLLLLRGADRFNSAVQYTAIIAASTLSGIGAYNATDPKSLEEYCAGNPTDTSHLCECDPASNARQANPNYGCSVGGPAPGHDYDSVQQNSQGVATGLAVVAGAGAGIFLTWLSRKLGRKINNAIIKTEEEIAAIEAANMGGAGEVEVEVVVLQRVGEVSPPPSPKSSNGGEASQPAYGETNDAPPSLVSEEEQPGMPEQLQSVMLDKLKQTKKSPDIS